MPAHTRSLSRAETLGLSRAHRNARPLSRSLPGLSRAQNTRPFSRALKRSFSLAPFASLLSSPAPHRDETSRDFHDAYARIAQEVEYNNNNAIACFHVTSRHCVATARNGDGGQEVIFYIRKHYTSITHSKCLSFASFMVVQIDQNTRSFYRVPKVVVHKGGKYKKLTEKHRKTYVCGREEPNGKIPVCVCVQWSLRQMWVNTLFMWLIITLFRCLNTLMWLFV